MTRTRYAIAAVMVATLAVATIWLYFLRDDGTSGAAHEATGTSAPTQSTGGGAPEDAAPRLETTGSDWDRIVKSIATYNHWLYNHPHPELLAAIIRPQCPCYNDGYTGLANLATKGWHHDPPEEPAAILKIVFNGNPFGSNSADIYVRFGPTGRSRVVDADGRVIEDKPPTTVPTAATWVLVRDTPDGNWRIDQQTSLGVVPKDARP